MGSLVTEAQIATYRRDGVVHLPGAFAGHLQELREAFALAMARPGKYAEFIGKNATWANLFEEGAEEREVEMYQDQIFMRDIKARLPSWGPMLESCPAAEISARLMGSSSAAFFYAHTILKSSGSPDRAIPWHQDLPYWKIDGCHIGSVWIALDDMPISASVRYVAGSHEWGLFRPRHFVDASPYDGRDEPEMPDIDAKLEAGETQALAFDVLAGDALCFDARTIHGSPGNPFSAEAGSRNDHRRIALRFGGDDCRYCDREGETAIPTPDLDAVHGLADGEHLACEDFPELWRQSR